MRYARLYIGLIFLCFVAWDSYCLYPFFHPLPKGNDAWGNALLNGLQAEKITMSVGGIVALVAMLLIVEIDSRLKKRTVNHGSAHRARTHEASPFYHRRPLFRVALFHRPSHSVMAYDRTRAEHDPYFLLGRYGRKPITLTEKQIESNVVLTAPIGAGKTSRVIVPNLLREQGRRSLFIPDVKKELVRLTAGYLSQWYEIQVFDPTDPDKSVGYNPLAHIRTYDDCQEFAACWVANTGQGDDDFWPNAAKMLLAATLMHVHVAEPTAPFSRVATILCTSTFEHMKDVLQHSPAREVRNGTHSLFDYLTLNPKLIGSLMTDIATRFELLKSETVQQVTASNQVTFEQMPQRPIALFLSIPRRSAQRFQPLSACFLLQMFTAWEEYAEQTLAGRLPRGITCYMDEFPNLGYIPNFSGIISTARHTGVGLVLIMQSFNQLDEKYGVSVRKTILTNCMTHLLLPGAGQEECEYYSDRVGRTTVKTTTYSARDTGTWWTENSTTQGETGRPLFTPDELRTMREDSMFMLYATAAPLMLDTFPYFKDRTVAHRANMPYATTHVTEEEAQPAAPLPIILLPAPKQQQQEQRKRVQDENWLDE
jgi:type IV secretion system protein VirD4